jgi:hypothetical protein
MTRQLAFGRKSVPCTEKENLFNLFEPSCPSSDCLKDFLLSGAEVSGSEDFRFVQIGSAPDDADALLDQGIDHAPELAPRDWIDANARLVEQKQFSSMKSVDDHCTRTRSRGFSGRGYIDDELF